MDDKTVFAIIAICLVTFIQLVAWHGGHNGQVFAFTSLIIGLIVGKILNIALPKGR